MILHFHRGPGLCVKCGMVAERERGSGSSNLGVTHWSWKFGVGGERCLNRTHSRLREQTEWGDRKERSGSLQSFGLRSTGSMLFLLTDVGILWEYHGCE